MLKILQFVLQFINIVIVLSLLLIHFVFKERTYQDSLYFYLFPLPIIILIVLLLSVFLKQRKYNLILAGILLILWLGRSFKIHFSEDLKESDMEVVFWNAAHERGFVEAFQENNGIVPDVLVLVEYSRAYNIKNLTQEYPNYHFYQSESDISIFSKTPIIIKSEVPSKHKSTVINFETNEINFYAIDVSGSTDVPREWELTFVDSVVIKDENTILLGDFNVPYESKYLKKIKSNFQHAFNKKGNGFRETWFWNIPLLSLDHIWVSKDLKILKTEKISTFKSDHSMIKTYVRKQP
ncbi:hypothetical protein L3X39_02360 [Sabulilitoribacter multivorans]|uniref:Endonuclease/exonuclease/phosphatase domain-containing protein n=1 Tax=Flaviramulus multivorans TaxID=1304750 RepID=A0ABS9IH30_9FLAO|nr:endonuclease/exonuclease/phosphatase family protein [Flaviramulus multivorans]MCF7559465.1 hypothetical protein [Flaviramulus multivorans]